MVRKRKVGRLVLGNVAGKEDYVTWPTPGQQDGHWSVTGNVVMYECRGLTDVTSMRQENGTSFMNR